MSKTEKATLEVIGIGAGGDGFADYKEGQAFLPFTVTGDVVDAILTPKGAKNWQGQVKKLIKKSPNRVAPACKYFRTCGGCSLQHVAPEYYQNWTVERINVALSHQGIEGDSILPPKLSPPQSRRRIALKAFHTGRKKGEAVVLGFNKRKSHQIVDIEECAIAKPQMIKLLPPLRELLRSLMNPRQGAEVQMLFLDDRTGLYITLPSEPDLAGREALAQFAGAHNIATLSIIVDGFEELVAENSPLTYGFNTDNGVAVDVPVTAFVQATDEGEQALQQAVTTALAGRVVEGASVLDLFSGLGTFSLVLAQSYKTHAVEGELKLVQAQEKAAHQKILSNLSVEHRDLFRRPITEVELRSYDAVVFDPPRAGAQTQVDMLAQSTVPLIVAVSCNPNTFARDARALMDGGYSLETIQPVDQFIWSHHVELVGVFSR